MMKRGRKLSTNTFPVSHPSSILTGKGVTDKIFKVWFLQDHTQYFYLHIEIQAQYRSNLRKRIYKYNYRIHDIDGRKVLSLVILGDNRPSWRPNSYKYEILDDEVTLKFHSIKLLDYLLRWDELESSNNFFAIIVMAHLKTLATTGNLAERAEWKWAIIQKIYEKGWADRDIIKVFDVVDKMMTLLKPAQAELAAKIKRLEEEKRMPLISPTVELAREEGELKGELKGEQNMVIQLLNYRFSEIDSSLIKQVRTLTRTQLTELGKAIFNFSTVFDLQQWLESKLKSVEKE